ncbi:MAG: hypothetical protein ACTS41_01175 [Candidatus Hodgkinia cicadicola]
MVCSAKLVNRRVINRFRSLERKSLGCQVCKISQERFNLTES